MKMEIAIISGKGVTGKSSISSAFATMNGSVVLADCDVDAANLFLIFNPSHEEEHIYIAGHKAEIDYDICTGCCRCVDYCRFDAISLKDDKVLIEEVSCDGCFLCSRICPENAINMIPNDKSRMYSGSFRNGKMVYGRLAPGEENSGKLVNMVREKAKQVSHDNNLKTIILDGPPGIGCPVISTITGVDKVVIVTEPTISGLSDMIRTIDVVFKFGLKPSVIINKSDLNSSMTQKIGEWCIENGIAVIAVLPFDPVMTMAMVQAKSVVESDPENMISIQLQKAWNKLLNTD
jgi:MinD superfamily P-loop ATPase